MQLRQFLPAVMCALLGCAPVDHRPAPGAVVDDLGRTVELGGPPERIVALVPAITDLIVALGETDRLVGRTRYDTDPRLEHLPAVGGGLDPNIEAVVGLRPDLVVAWPSADQPLLGQLDDAGIPVYGAGSQSLADVRRHTRNLGLLLAREDGADSLLDAFDRGFDRLTAVLQGVPPTRALYVTWHDPPMTTGPGTFIDSIITIAGGRNVFDDVAGEWPQVSLEEIVRRDPDVVIVPVSDRDDPAAIAWIDESPGWRDLRAVRTGRVLLVDADLFTRPGPRLVEAAGTLARLMHPERFADEGVQ